MTPGFGEVGATAFKERVLSASEGPRRADGVSVLQVNLGYRCTLYDCDFNQMLGLTVTPCCSRTIESFDFAALSRRDIAVDNHCYGCTAGQGSS